MLAFWLTVLLEAPWWVLGIWQLTRGAHRLRNWGSWQRLLPAVATALLVNLVTHPLVWWITADRDLTVWLIAEMSAVLVEVVLVALLLRAIGARTRWPIGLLLGIGANATSALVGVLFF